MLRDNLSNFLDPLNDLLKVNFGLGRGGYQHAVIDEFLCAAAVFSLGTDVCDWMFKQKSAWFKVNKIPL